MGDPHHRRPTGCLYGFRRLSGLDSRRLPHSPAGRIRGSIGALGGRAEADGPRAAIDAGQNRLHRLRHLLAGPGFRLCDESGVELVAARDPQRADSLVPADGHRSRVAGARSVGGGAPARFLSVAIEGDGEGWPPERLVGGPPPPVTATEVSSQRYKRFGLDLVATRAGEEVHGVDACHPHHDLPGGVDVDPLGVVELARSAAVAAVQTDQRAALGEALNAAVGHVGNPDAVVRTDGYAPGMAKLRRLLAKPAPGFQRGTIQRELADPVVEEVGHVEGISIDGKAEGKRELPRTRTLTAPGFEDLPVGGEMDDPVPQGVGDEQRAVTGDGDSMGSPD